MSILTHFFFQKQGKLILYLYYSETNTLANFVDLTFCVPSRLYEHYLQNDAILEKRQAFVAF